MIFVVTYIVFPSFRALSLGFWHFRLIPQDFPRHKAGRSQIPAFFDSTYKNVFFITIPFTIPILLPIPDSNHQQFLLALPLNYILHTAASYHPHWYKSSSRHYHLSPRHLQYLPVISLILCFLTTLIYVVHVLVYKLAPVQRMKEETKEKGR